ncbi:alpha/beta hydrolase [Polynucleobacter paneuropaeus]|nr:alpha/beta hydrolase [Polynucleobacter paneuropaeus]
MKLQDDGSTNNHHTFVRALDQWSQYHIDAVLVDTPYDLGDLQRGDLRDRSDHLDRVHEVAAYYKDKYHLPIWIFGHSMGTSTATNFVNGLDKNSHLISGIIIAGTVRTASVSDDVSLPILALHHVQDSCGGTPPDASARIIKGRPPKFIAQLEMIEGGTSQGDECQSFAYHGFNQTEPELIRRAAKFILGN